MFVGYLFCGFQEVVLNCVVAPAVDLVSWLLNNFRLGACFIFVVDWSRSSSGLRRQSNSLR